MSLALPYLSKYIYISAQMPISANTFQGYFITSQETWKNLFGKQLQQLSVGAYSRTSFQQI